MDIDDDNDGVLDATESPSCFYTAAEASTIINVTSDLTVEAVARPYTNAYDGVNTTASYTGWALNQSSVGLSAYEITPTIPVAISSIDFSMYNLAMTNGAANTLKLQGYANNVWEDLDVAAVRTVINATQTFTNTLHPNKIYEKFRITGGAGVAYYGRTQEIYLNISNYIASANPKATCTANADGDLLLNHLDTDSDGDNCNDAVEASVGPKGTVVPLTGAVGANGLVDSKETAVDNGIVNYTSTYSTYATSNTLIVCADTDNDGIGDIIDIDDDNDGVLDVMEIGASCTAYSAHQLRVPLLVTSELTGTAGSTSNLNDYDLQTGFSVSGSTAGKVVFEVTPIVPMAILQMDVDVTVFYPALSGNFHLEGYNGTAWVVLSGSVNQAGLLGNSTSSPVGSSSGSHVFPVTQNSGVYQKYRLVGEAGSTIAASAGGTNIVREIYLQPLHGQPALFNSTCTPDADGDGTPNQFDLDSDNDGCSDGVEAGSTLASNNNITVIPTGTDANNNGLLDQYETGTTGTINYTSTYLKYATVNTISACADTDGDGVGDLADIDDDNDGITDVMEGLSEGGAACPSASSFTSTNIFRYTNQESPSTGSNWDIFSFDPLTFASAEKMTYGDGLLFREYGTGAQVYLLNYDADPVIGNSFYEFKFTTVSGTLAYPLLTTFTGTNFGVAATLSFRISEDNFKTSILLKGPTVINNAVNASAVFDVPFAMQPNKTYQLRVYVHSPQPTNGGQFDEMYLKGVAASGVPNLSAFTACTQTGITTLDTDGDGVPNHLDLDSDGDGCSDAIEGGASFSSADLVVSTMAGGNSGTSYTGTSTSPVTQNLGNTVTTLGVPTIATTGQTIGTSQDKTAQDANCVTCVAGTTAPAITPTTATNTCPATTVDLSALANTGTKPAGTSLIWSTHKVPTSAADTLTNLTTVSTAGKYYAMYFDKVGNCYSPADSVVFVYH
ncbi:MAG: hypothetical protein U5N85_07375 [Arcicella sp.]|nr:hypothetical protein [Arcicella sp.]